MDIMKKIIELRKQRGETQSSMAEKLGIAPNNYGKIENEKTELSVNRLNQITEILGVSFLELMTGETKKVEDVENTDTVRKLEKRVSELEEMVKDKNKIIETVESKYKKLYETIDESLSMEIQAIMYRYDLGKVKAKSISDSKIMIVTHDEYKKGAEDGKFSYMKSSKEVILTEEELVLVFTKVIEGDVDVIKTRLIIDGLLDKSMYAGHIKKFINIAMKRNLFEWQDMGEDEGFWIWNGYNDEKNLSQNN